MTPQPPRFERALPDWAHFKPLHNGDPVPDWLFEDLDQSVRIEIGLAVLDHEAAVLKSKLETVQRVSKALNKAQ